MQNRNVELDGLRGLAAVAVVFYHAVLAPIGSSPAALLQPIQSLSTIRDAVTKVALTVVNGHSAVLLFFILSGFVLTLSLDKTNGNAFSIIVKFTIRRVCRLYPCLIASLLLLWAVSLIYQSVGAKFQVVTIDAFLQNAILVKNVMIGPTHTIQVELLVIPFMLAMFATRAVFGTCGVLAWVVYSVIAMDYPNMVLNFPYLGDWLVAFAFGMLVASPLAKNLTKGTSGIGIVVLTVAFVFCRLFSPLLDHTAVVTQIIAGTWLVAALYYSSSDSSVRSFLGHPTVQLLGKISYSLYLINVIVMLVILSFLHNPPIYRDMPLEIGLLVGLATTLLSIPVSILFERWFEQGGVNLGRQLTKPRRPMAFAAAE
ncbi:acyltransferase family protein [Rhizobium mesoamericanum]|uniref:Acyltransferase 3 domain-containing protein n=1 Tax=Rhizobium mesoamericanum STM3625 TaxID=1211777 RepID=K0PTI3_9HYPH|nr:acyltransferase [Rhizobium mesoamericanum]CCM77133.1 membrane hypothetical protein [Rhizobium mesoamericanum STM3625]